MNYTIIEFSSINPKNLKEHFKNLSLTYLKSESKVIGKKIKELLPAYPDILTWYEKVIKEINEDSDKREMFIVLSEKDGALSILGLMILKNSIDEKKICTLRVKEDYQRKGIGSKLLKKAFKYLKTDKPLITIPEESIFIFSAILEKYGFEKKEERLGLYREGKIEYIYNGIFK